ncbi:hypothetical protein glysoja_043646 [Glycine soja]|uniref:Uncharacterized protein n=1 Tax=Glycine soja TaxID=3848 RepID=A0A0B2QP20_GLYSO|nr:hypothetical protein glysoja_043646 [Glycine soja]
MGEFLVDTTVFEDKKERWSSFSPNKYLEEVEKCATPRSVAQKKAYFGAHSKKVVARKAELLAQEKQREKDSFGLEEHSGIDMSGLMLMNMRRNLQFQGITKVHQFRYRTRNWKVDERTGK